MAILGLANVSAYAHWVLASDDYQLLGHRSWTSDETKDISSLYSAELQALLKSAKTDLNQVLKIYVVTGPGTFTGLRNSASFALGLAQSLGAALYPIPSFDVYKQPLFVPTRHQVAKTMSLEQALAAGLEFIKISSPNDFEVKAPQENDLVLGLKNQPDWPGISDLLTAMKYAQKDLARTEMMLLYYGLEPKISGKR